MTTILCATRGGEGSGAVRRRAYELARTHDARLIFLYVVDPTFLGKIDPSMVPAVREEMHWLGDIMLRIAQQQAHGVGVSAEIMIVEGSMPDTIDRVLNEVAPDYFLLGAPRGTTANVFGDDAIEQFAQSLQRPPATTIEIVRPDGPETLTH